MRLTDLHYAVPGAVQESGWQSRGWDFFGPVRGIILHHTATPSSAQGDFPSMRVVRDGRSDLPGPLSQLGLGRSGTVYIIAAGRANHAGSGSWPGLSGNLDTIGIEAEHPGTGPWPTVQYDAYVRLVAQLVMHYRIPTVIGHKEWTSRKIDPNFDMDEFRERVSAEMATRFKDVPEGHPFYAEIEWLARTGITKGANPPKNDLFRPDQAVTRGQMAAFLKRLHDRVT